MFSSGSGTSVDRYACPVVVQGTLVLFGGLNEPRQVSGVYNYGVKRISTLKFDLTGGTAAFHNGAVYLCFDKHVKRLCRKRY